MLIAKTMAQGVIRQVHSPVES